MTSDLIGDVVEPGLSPRLLLSERRADGGAGAGDAGWRGAATGTWVSAQGSSSIHQ